MMRQSFRMTLASFRKIRVRTEWPVGSFGAFPTLEPMAGGFVRRVFSLSTLHSPPISVGSFGAFSTLDPVAGGFVRRVSLHQRPRRSGCTTPLSNACRPHPCTQNVRFDLTMSDNPRTVASFVTFHIDAEARRSGCTSSVPAVYCPVASFAALSVACRAPLATSVLKIFRGVRWSSLVRLIIPPSSCKTTFTVHIVHAPSSRRRAQRNVSIILYCARCLPDCRVIPSFSKDRDQDNRLVL